ncbi:MAG: hypothetical protein A3F95_00565 [Candidatus Nealsonbacteria bacterium RIFCSPLOWO2_12_FULL_39_31]|uniref:Tagatose-bisphosphate aldolase n=1 Tax=Candidatus Nealsonbacteria bacterium RIFCSPLOWO2_12_FULL_39_31 TaxID=1801676 RepID=A0A1G2EJN5_9BACT|nr:MAG: hypothetical protein A3F95_00565 [Candidatus Nealsonbacteria bacterium RIFCSPLOWO2_12_FULL_39_31]
MKNLKNILQDARKNHYAIGQFNISTFEQLKGIFGAVNALRTPVIIGTSEGEAKFLGIEEISALIKIAEKKYKIPFFLNLDHGKDLALIKKAVDYGYSAVHFDGSSFPFEENARYTKEVIKYARKKSVLIEGELGAIKGESGIHQKKVILTEDDLTSPEQAKKFADLTNVDCLAIAVGTTHGMYKEEKGIDFERLGNISCLTMKKFLVLHGGSGISEEDIKKAIDLGIVKININTEIRLIWRDCLEKKLRENQEETKPYKLLADIKDAIQKKVEEKIRMFETRACK